MVVPSAGKTPIGELILRLTDAYFDLDRDGLRSDARNALRTDSSLLRDILAQAPNTLLVVEGHCDERGSAEYNLALGARRAGTAREFLIGLGVPANALQAVSYGKERPQCTEENEECWERNRRAHLAPRE